MLKTMKKTLLILALFCTSIAQAQLFQPGDKWIYLGYHVFPPGNYMTSYTYYGDTIINSIPCQNVSGLMFHSDSNKIEFLNWNSNEFVTIFDYSLNIGDSLFIPTEFCQDTGYYIHIIEKGIDTISNTPFRYLTYDTDASTGWPVFTGKYYERIGMINRGLIPNVQCINDMPILSCLNVFKNAITGDTIFNNDADCPIILSTTENPAINFSLYPNPVVDGMLFIKSDLVVKNITLINTLGQTVLSATPVNNSLETGYLPQGMYIAKLTFANGKQAYKPLVY